MNLNGKYLDEWLYTCKSAKYYPYGIDCPTDYKKISKDLNKWVHDNVNAGAQASDETKIYLTNHGVEHIKALINRATSLVDNNPYCELSPFEVYVLLLSMHIHDVGNIFGRSGHELNSSKIIDLIGDGIVGQDNVLWEYVFDIAKAHKGQQIELLPVEDYIGEKPIRMQLLAAILKFCDELAENTMRADLAAITLNILPEESKLYHYYAKSLDSVIPDVKAREVKMIFHVNEDLLSQKFLKKEEGKEEHVYLIDEIYLRTLKTYSERAYCMRFMRPYINIDIIKVSIRIKLLNKQRRENGYELSETGLIKVHMDEVFKICPHLKEFTGLVLHEKVVNNQL